MTRPEGSAALIGFWSIIVQEPLSGHFSPVRTVVPIGHKPEIVAAMAVPQYLWPPAWAALRLRILPHFLLSRSSPGSGAERLLLRVDRFERGGALIVSDEVVTGAARGRTRETAAIGWGRDQ